MKAKPELVKASTIGVRRTEDVVKLIPEGEEGVAELLGMIVPPLIEVSRRTGLSMRAVCEHILEIAGHHGADEK
jgi:hypothetical protein